MTQRSHEPPAMAIPGALIWPRHRFLHRLCVVDQALKDESEVFVEAGDHRDIIRLDGATFAHLMGKAWYGTISKADDAAT